MNKEEFMKVCEHREKYTFLCKHPKMEGICLCRREFAPEWCPLRHIPLTKGGE